MENPQLIKLRSRTTPWSSPHHVLTGTGNVREEIVMQTGQGMTAPAGKDCTSRGESLPLERKSKDNKEHL